MACKTRRGVSCRHCLQSELMSETLPKIYIKGKDWRKARAGFGVNWKGEVGDEWTDGSVWEGRKRQTPGRFVLAKITTALPVVSV